MFIPSKSHSKTKGKRQEKKANQANTKDSEYLCFFWTALLRLLFQSGEYMFDDGKMHKRRRCDEN